ncbi:MAG: hypothetical protein GKR87_08345 [Kiritimatiellae bacterium]|nr:hypothetical protein [Kiritimatiellia bacterium]
MSTLGSILGTIQRQLFPALEEEIGPLSQHEEKFVKVVEVAEVERSIVPYL